MPDRLREQLRACPAKSEAGWVDGTWDRRVLEYFYLRQESAGLAPPPPATWLFSPLICHSPDVSHWLRLFARPASSQRFKDLRQ